MSLDCLLFSLKTEGALQTSSLHISLKPNIFDSKKHLRLQNGCERCQSTPRLTVYTTPDHPLILDLPSRRPRERRGSVAQSAWHESRKAYGPAKSYPRPLGFQRSEFEVSLGKTGRTLSRFGIQTCHFVAPIILMVHWKPRESAVKSSLLPRRLLFGSLSSGLKAPSGSSVVIKSLWLTSGVRNLFGALLGGQNLLKIKLQGRVLTDTDEQHHCKL